MGSRPWFFGVTRRHRSRDHSTRGGRLPMGYPGRPLAPLKRYGASKYMYTNKHTDGHTHGTTDRTTNLIISSSVHYVHTWRR